MAVSPVSSRSTIAAVLITASLVLAGVVPTAPASAQRPARRVIFLSLDGAADWLLDRWMAEGKAPAFARMARDGAVADGMLATWPSLTAVAHATLWTGAPPLVHGITGNQVPFSPTADHTLLHSRSGYLGAAFRAEPIWVAAARANRRVLVLQATQQVPFADGFAGEQLLQFDVYANELARARIVEGTLAPDGYVLRVADEDVRLAKADGDGVWIAGRNRSFTVWPRDGRRWTGTLRARAGTREGFFRAGLIRYEPASGAFVLAQGRLSQIVSSAPRELEPFAATAGTIIETGLNRWYEAGRFGRVMADGGDGAAEATFADAIAVNQEYFDRSLDYAQRKPWDLLVCYVSSLDLVHHTFVGLLDPASSAHTPEIAARTWPIVERLFARVADGYVADLRRRFPDATIVVTSDHGMEGVGRVLYPNAILRQAGLLALHDDGSVDLARTRAMYLGGRGGIVTLNTAAWKEGVVPEADRRATLRAVAEALLAARDPDTGAFPIRAVLDPERDGASLGFGGPGVDLMFDPAPDYAPSERLDTRAIAASSAPLGEGEHGPAPWRRKLHGIFFAAGPGVRPGVTLPVFQSVDVAATVAKLLGIPPPAQSVGRALPIVEEQAPRAGTP